jgi:hypothetical protein
MTKKKEGHSAKDLAFRIDGKDLVIIIGLSAAVRLKRKDCAWVAGMITRMAEGLPPDKLG